MMLRSLFKKRLSPDEAGKLYLQALTHRYIEQWESDVEGFNSLALNEIIDVENGNILMEFITATIAIETRSILNHSFSYYEGVLLAIYQNLRKIDDFGELAVNRLQNEYLAAMRRSEKDGFPPTEGVLDVLFSKMELNKSPLVGTAALSIIISKIGIWKIILQKHRITQ